MFQTRFSINLGERQYLRIHYKFDGFFPLLKVWSSLANKLIFEGNYKEYDGPLKQTIFARLGKEVKKHMKNF